MNRRAGLLVALGLVALGVVFGLHQIVDPDLFQQVAVGRAILDDPLSIGTSSFTHTYPGHPYIEDKWLASVLVAAVAALGGHDGLMIYQILLVLLATVSWFAMLRATGASAPIALAGVAPILFACAFRLESRPDTWSHALLAAMVLLTTLRLSPRRAYLSVFLLTVVWVNLHGYFVNGLLVLLAATVASWLGATVPLLGSGPGRLRRGLGLMLTGIAAGAVHPQGVHALIWPVRQIVILWREPALKQAIQEFFPTTELLEGATASHYVLYASAVIAALVLGLRTSPSSHRLRLVLQVGTALLVWSFAPRGLGPWPYRGTAVLFFMALFEIVPALRARRFFPLLLFGGFSVMAFPMVRNLSLVPPAALLLLAPSWSEAASGGAKAGTLVRRLAVAAVVIALLLGVSWSRVSDRLASGTYRHPAWFGWGLAADRFPIAAADLVAREELPGELLNNFDTSGYLLYRFHPQRAAFIADNTSIYPASFLSHYREQIMAGAVDPESLHESYGVRTAVLDHGAMETPALLSRLMRSPSWALVHVDRGAAVFLYRDTETQGWIDQRQFDLDREAARLAAEPLRRSRLPGWLLPRRRLFPDLNLGIFLRAVGRPDLALAEADRLWRDGPATEIAAFAAAAAEEAGQLEQAIPRLEAALQQDRRSELLQSWLARALFHRAVGQISQGQLDEADDDLARSARLAPTEPGAPLARARVALMRGEPALARSLLGEALALDSDGAVRRTVVEDPELSSLVAP